MHDILPASDPRSTINPQNLPTTCGKCHPGIGTRLGAEFFRIHAPPGAAEGKPWIVNFITWLYIALIVMTIGGMGTFTLLDYLRKARAHIRAVRAAKDAEMRMTWAMRLQHFVLLFLFTLLVYTGFAFKFPEAFWSWPFRALPDGSAVRAMVHRICGWTFAGFFLAHLIAMVGTRRGRGHVRALWLVWDDLKDALAQLACNLGLRRPPPHRLWNYAEKSEYWALLWGSVVMISTGVMLIFTNTVLAMLPKVWHDVVQVIHYYEAVLATLAILVWHFYWVVFDPAEYPMNPSWLIGTKPARRAEAPEPPPKPEPPAAAAPASKKGNSSDEML